MVDADNTPTILVAQSETRAVYDVNVNWRHDMSPSAENAFLRRVQADVDIAKHNKDAVEMKYLKTSKEETKQVVVKSAFVFAGVMTIAGIAAFRLTDNTALAWVLFGCAAALTGWGAASDGIKAWFKSKTKELAKVE